MSSEFFNPQLLLTFASGAWQLGNIVSFIYIMVVLRRDAKATSTTAAEVEERFRVSTKRELVPRVGIYVLGTVVFQVLLNMFG